MTASPTPNKKKFPQNAIPIRPGLNSVAKLSDFSSKYLSYPEGQLQVHSSRYRGSFSSVLSEAMRTAGLGRKVLVAQFLKGGVNQGCDSTVKLCGHLELLRPDIACCLPAEIEGQNLEVSKAKQAVLEVWNTCKEKLLSHQLEKLILDEIGLAVVLGLIEEEDLIDTLENRKESIDVILTGPCIPEKVINMADQVTELRCSS